MRSAKIEAAKGIYFQKAVGGKFEAASLFTTGDYAYVRPAARLPVHRLPLHSSSRLCAQIDFSKANLRQADFQKASFTTTGTNAEIDFSGAKLNDANFKDAVVKASGENSAVKNDPTA